jgi:hypothetical protein
MSAAAAARERVAGLARIEVTAAATSGQRIARLPQFRLIN